MSAHTAAAQLAEDTTTPVSMAFRTVRVRFGVLFHRGVPR